MVRRLTLSPIERYKEEGETSKSSCPKANQGLDNLESQMLERMFKSCITQKVKSRVQATRLQHRKYIKNTSGGTRE